MRNQSRLGRFVLAILAMTFVFALLEGCGNSTSPVGPTIDASPAAPHQTVLGLNLTARVSGAIAISVATDQQWTVEAGAICTDANLPCPRPTSLEWKVTGAFCEQFGSTNSAGAVFKCRGFGTARVTAYDRERTDVKGEMQIEVAPIF